MQLTIDIDNQIYESLIRIARSRSTTNEQAATFLLERTLFGIPHQSGVKINDYKPQSIIVVLDPRIDRIKKRFRCNNCGNVVFNYYGGVKLVMNGQFDADNEMVSGDDVDWFSKLGIPDEVICSGRVSVRYDDGRTGKKRCATTYYRIGT